MAIDVEQDYTGQDPAEPRRTFKDFAAADIGGTFFNLDEFAEVRNIDGRDMEIVLDENAMMERSAHWEAGAKQNFDSGLYRAEVILYVRTSDYGKKPKVGKQLVLDKARTYKILSCADDAGIYAITMERVRQ